MLNVGLKNNWATVGLAAGLVACIGDFILTGWLGYLSPGYSFMRDSMSILGESNSPFRWVFAGWGIVFAILWYLYAHGLELMFPRQQKIKKFSQLMIVYGLGEGIGSGLFPFDHSKHGFLTLSGIVHSLLSLVGVLALLLSPFFLARHFKSAHRSVERVSNLMPLTGIVLLSLFAVSRLPLSENTFLAFRGLWQRLFLLTYYLYLCWISILLYQQRVVTTGDAKLP